MKEKNKNIAEAEKTLISKPLLATSIERVMILKEAKEQYKDMPQPKRFASVLSTLLRRVSVPIEEYDLVAGRCVDRELTPEEEEIFQEYLHQPGGKTNGAFFSSGHCTYSWDYVVQEGIPGLRAKAEASLERQTDEEKRLFLTSIIEGYDALKEYLLRYAKAAQEKGMHRLAENLYKAATERPDSFCVALQLLWIITLVDCAYITPNPTLTVGRLDQLLFPLYQKDMENGRLTREEATEYITDYYCKHNLIMGRGEHQVGDATNSTTFDRIYCFDAPQYLMIAGTDKQGASAVNDLTLLFAECIRPAFKNPVIVVRYFRNMDKQHPKLWHILTEKALKSASLMFYNDDNMIATFRRMGIPEEDCRNYVHFGCNWPSIGDNGAWMNSGPNSPNYAAYFSKEEAIELRVQNMRTRSAHSWPEDFMIVLKELANKEADQVSIEDFYQKFFALVEEFLNCKLDYYAKELTVRRRRPAAVLTYGDCFYRDSVANAECCAAGAKYHFGLQPFFMFGTVADCFITVDELVFQRQAVTLRQLLTAVEDNFVGHEAILAMCRNVSKYGSDTSFSNAHVKRLAETYAGLVIEKSRPYLKKMGLFLEPCIQSDTWHLKMGEDFGATPDGRLAHTAFSQNARPSNGACVNGMTAMLNAMLNIPSDGALSGALNLDVDPKQFEGEKGRELFAAMLAVYFNKGGLHAQVSCVGLNDLIDAQQHPELHRDLRVRVTGYSGIFVDICRRLQDDIIERFK